MNGTRRCNSPWSLRKVPSRHSHMLPRLMSQVFRVSSKVVAAYQPRLFFNLRSPSPSHVTSLRNKPPNIPRFRSVLCSSHSPLVPALRRARAPSRHRPLSLTIATAQQLPTADTHPEPSVPLSSDKTAKPCTAAALLSCQTKTHTLAPVVHVFF